MQESAAEIVLRTAALFGAQRVLLVTPGPSGGEIVAKLLPGLRGHRCTLLDSSTTKLNAVADDAVRIRGRATRLPFMKHSFDALLSFEALYSIRPPWTVIAEFHRVLRPDGVLVLL